MSPWDQQTSDGADKGRTQTPHAGVQPEELEVARTAVHVADRLTSFFSSRRGAAPCHCTLKCTPKEPRGQAYHSVPLATFTLRQVDDYACHNGEAQLLTYQVRALEPGTPAYAYAKGLLCSYCPVGVVSPFRAQQFMAGNGTRVLRTGRCVRRRGSQRGSRRERKPAGGKGQRQRVEEEIADRIIELLDQGELPPWEKGWSDSQSGVPVNAISMKPYRGINRWMTLITQKAMGYDEPRWLTYRQAEALGGHVRKDEKSTIIIFWKRVAFREREEGEGGENEDHTNNGNDGAPLDVSRIRTYPILRSYRVFNLEQTQDCQIKPLPTPEVTDHDPIQDAEAIIAGMPGPPEIEFYENANYVPHYQPAKDVIRVPKMGRYRNPEDYYNTVFHELTHATGHPKRLERFSLDANANDLHAYGREELVERDASYIRHWRDAISADKPMIIRSATLAQRAVDLILGEKPPEFLPDRPEPQSETAPEEPHQEEPNPEDSPSNPGLSTAREPNENPGGQT